MITVVSGLPRSGTSLVMQMLAAGGMAILSDDKRQADENNPRGYLEYEKVKSLARDQAWIPEAEGKAVKIISHLLPHLPGGHEYRILLLVRPIGQIIASQKAMLERGGADGPEIPAATLEETYARQMNRIQEFLQARQDMRMTFLYYPEIIGDPEGQAQVIAGFLELPLDTAAMAAAVQSGLWHNRETKSF